MRRRDRHARVTHSPSGRRLRTGRRSIRWRAPRRSGSRSRRGCRRRRGGNLCAQRHAPCADSAHRLERRPGEDRAGGAWAEREERRGAVRVVSRVHPTKHVSPVVSSPSARAHPAMTTSMPPLESQKAPKARRRRVHCANVTGSHSASGVGRRRDRESRRIRARPCGDRRRRRRGRRGRAGDAATASGEGGGAGEPSAHTDS